ncbi:MAG: class I SAM-dependent methyltransferase [Pseudomonadota bacterium]
MHTYTSIAAQHYAAYRPPLHTSIVQKALDGSHFNGALDVGCGTGDSTIALLPYCDEAVGLDPSPDMIALATSHPRIDYRVGTATDLPAADNKFDLVSVAGALPYIDVDPFAAELRRVCTPSANILVYDFRVYLGDLLQRLGLPMVPSTGTYTHSKNLSGVAGFGTVIESSGPTKFEATAQAVAHLLLANETRFQCLAEHFETGDPAEPIGSVIARLGDSFNLTGTFWYALHNFAEWTPK